ncbi:hypothetical protein LJR219_003900 [Phenylobacterium sp. LjRoot219]|uniref:hypothetical protein n=1 Tax=Phenylobacterium sp. LjRoot219 TaxID=3342283 RepID=UPI003ECF3875
MAEIISIARRGARWAIKHRGGFLGDVASADEAERLGRDLVGWLTAQGRHASLQFESAEPLPRSPAPQRESAPAG